MLGVMLPVGVMVGVAVEVAVEVTVVVTLPVAVAVEVKVGVNVGVNEPVVTERLRKMTIVWDAAVPSTIRILALPLLKSLLINRSAGIV
jgi:hypothetical protein